MAGWLESIFGNLPSPPTHPASRGATFGAGGYQQIPSSPNVEDRRAQGPDYAAAIRKAPGDWTQVYWPSDMGPGLDPWGQGHFSTNFDAGLAAPLIATGRNVRDNPIATGAYAPSFPQNLSPPRRAVMPSGSSVSDPSVGASGLPYIPPHLPISPGDPGWTPPPSFSGPHNPGGDPNRPGYGAAAGMPMGALSGNWWSGQ
jgi:hypothetical protein